MSQKKTNRDKVIATVAGTNDPQTIRGIKDCLKKYAPQNRIALIPDAEFEALAETAKADYDRDGANIADRIRMARVARGWTQEELAEHTGVIPAAVAHWEAGRRVPDATSLAALCRSLEIKADWLLGLHASLTLLKIKQLQRFRDNVREAIKAVDTDDPPGE